MQDKLDKNIDKLVKKAITNIKIDSPSKVFTSNLMSKIEILNSNKTIVYKPLISKPVWLFIGLIFSSFVLYVLFSENLDANNLIDYSQYKIDLPTFNLPKIASSKTLTYIVLSISVIIMIQGALLKKQLDNRINY